MEFGSKPDPETAIGVPPLRHVPGSAVRVGEPPDDVEVGVQGTVVVVVAPAAVVDVVVGAVVVVVFLAPAAVAKVKHSGESRHHRHGPDEPHPNFFPHTSHPDPPGVPPL